MALNTVRYQQMLSEAYAGTIKPNDAKRLFKALKRRFNRNELETFRERVTLSALLIYGHTLQKIRDNAKERTEFIQEEMRKHKKKLSTQPKP